MLYLHAHIHLTVIEQETNSLAHPNNDTYMYIICHMQSHTFPLLVSCYVRLHEVNDRTVCFQFAHMLTKFSPESTQKEAPNTMRTMLHTAA